MKTQLEIGDKIKRFEVNNKEIDYVYVIDKVTKTLAKCGDFNVFHRDIIYDVKLPDDRFVGIVKMKGEGFSFSRNYFLLK